jgi:hypothetical protein
MLPTTMPHLLWVPRLPAAVPIAYILYRARGVPLRDLGFDIADSSINLVNGTILDVKTIG